MVSQEENGNFDSVPLVVVSDNNNPTSTSNNVTNQQQQQIIYEVDFNALAEKIALVAATLKATTVESRTKSLLSEKPRSVDINAFMENDPNQPQALTSSLDSQAKLLTIMAQIRENYRRAALNLKARKTEISEAKARGDSQRLLLQNIKYEILQVHNEITKCRQFETIYDKIDLISEEEFQLKSGISLANGTVTEHEYMLKRLDFEQQDRLKMSKMVRELEAERNELKNNAEFRKVRINQVVEMFQNWIKSSQSLQRMVNYVPEQTPEEMYGKEFSKLSPVLQKVYALLYASFSNFPMASISIAGETHLSKDDLQARLELASSSAMDLDQEVMMKDDDTFDVDEGNSRKVEEDEEDLLMEETEGSGNRNTANDSSKYPVFIEIIFKEDSGNNGTSSSNGASTAASTLSLFIYHYPSINRLSLVTSTSSYATAAEAKEGSILSYLFHSIPLASSWTDCIPFSLDYPANVTPSGMEGFPYAWLQAVVSYSSFNYENDAKNDKIKQQLVKEWVEQITRLMYLRWRDRISLLKQVSELESLHFNTTGAKFTSKLKSFQVIVPENGKGFIDGEDVGVNSNRLEEEIRDTSAASASAAEIVSSSTLNLCSMKFAVQKPMESAQEFLELEGTIDVKIEYPTLAPRFSLSFPGLALAALKLGDQNEFIESVERELNDGTLPNITAAGDKPNVLTIQMRNLFTRLESLKLNSINAIANANANPSNNTNVAISQDTVMNEVKMEDLSVTSVAMEEGERLQSPKDLPQDA